MELGLFQLENLFLNPNRFLFFDLRAEPEEVAEPVRGLLSKAHRVQAAEVLEFLASQKIGSDFPLVLICEEGHTSSRVAAELETAGYQQVYVVMRGVTGLLSEL